MAKIPQPMCPHGAVGVIVGGIVDLLNRPANRYAERRLHGDAILEIGVGTGQLIRLLARSGTHRFVADVDPFCNPICDVKSPLGLPNV